MPPQNSELPLHPAVDAMRNPPPATLQMMQRHALLPRKLGEKTSRDQTRRIQEEMRRQRQADVGQDATARV